MNETLLDLAARCERAEGPDRELDCGIAKALGWTSIITGNRRGRNGRSPEGTWKLVPRFTASLDSAMTLVPEGWSWLSGNRVGWRTQSAEVFNPNIYESTQNVCATTPALALCAAALRARASLATGGEM